MLPTALAVNHEQTHQVIVVGFETGRFNRYIFDVQTSQLILRSSQVGLGNGAITAMALSSPYLLIVSQYRNLSLYKLGDQCHGLEEAVDFSQPHELAALKADNMIAPMTLSLRVSASEIVATVVYSFLHIGCGWSQGIQELRFAKDGQQLDCRIASTVDSQYGMSSLHGLSPPLRQRRATLESIDREDSAPTVPSILHQQPPTSMSYSHPYLLTSHADNTLTMYLVVSDLNSLFVRGGQRLWGHTSSVSAVQVTNRGKAVSVSSRGDEIRIWELETAVSSLGSRRPLKDEKSIQVSPEHNRTLKTGSGLTSKPIPQDMGGLGMAPNAPQEMSRMHECVGFDDERVFLLREKQVGTQLLECYDFT
jgi:WD40 repeat protein